MRTTLYLHGFLSHPDSNKGSLLRLAHEKAGIPFEAPELYMSPKEVAELLTKTVCRLGAENVNVVGSSLGGFYAAWLAEHFDINRAVLLNPALGNWGKVDFRPGWMQVSGIDKKMYVCESFMDELNEMLVREVTRPERCLSLLSLKDEVLDPTVTAKMLAKTKIIEIAEGDHRISDFTPYVEPILEFLRS